MTDALLRAVALSKSFGAIQALQEVSFEVRAGDVIALVGADGAGKTTLIRLILGLLSPTAGSIELFGVPATSRDRRTRREIGFVLESSGLHEEMTVWEIMAYYAAIYRLQDWEMRARELLSTNHLADRMQDLAGDLPAGMRQKLALCRAALTSPRLLVLDEPLSNVDSIAEIELRGSIRRLRSSDRAILLSAHSLMGVADVATRVISLEGGRLLFDASVECALSAHSLQPEGVHDAIRGHG